jgi:hypothetical protein
MGGLVTHSLVMFGLVMFSLAMYGFVMFAFTMFNSAGLSRLARLPVIDRVALVRVVTSLLPTRELTIRCLDVLLVLGALFRGSRSCVNSTRAVEANAIVDDRFVNHCRVSIRVMNK